MTPSPIGEVSAKLALSKFPELVVSSPQIYAIKHLGRNPVFHGLWACLAREISKILSSDSCIIILYLDFLNDLGVFEIKDKTVLDRLTLKPSSRFHLIEGSGLPFALHLKVTLSPSRIITSLDVKASSIFGGTV
uniref:Uncharacterized protein n=1 Tax=Glossina palpalis gambiensis TaxID=67801 RepID=A0A1B0C1Z0_9MUSC